MKVSIIGGGGLVGSCAGFALQCGGVVREIALLDLNVNLAAGQALDIMHGGPSVADQRISSGGYEHIPTSDIRSEERRIGKECVTQCRSRWSPYH